MKLVLFITLCYLSFCFASLSSVNQLYYFNARGRAEQIRLFLADQTVTYDDIRLTGDEFEALKKKLPFGHVPVLNISTSAGGYRWIADTAAINIWMGRETDMWPTDRLAEEILVSYASASEDLRLQRYAILGFGTFNATAAAQSKFLPVIADWLFYFERQLTENSFGTGDYLLGSQFTPVDCRVWDVLDQVHTLMNLHPAIYNDYPKTQAFRTAVETRPNIAAYLKTRK